MSIKLAVSGANGFVGQAVMRRLVLQGRPVIAFVREGHVRQLEGRGFAVTSLSDQKSWYEALRQCSVFIHCAGLAHIRQIPAGKDLIEFREVNTDLTLKLARSAASAGVKRFVFVSSIGVNGSTSHQDPFTPDSAANPQTPYAISKYEAEQGLLAISQETGLEIVVVRPPLVYGFGAPGNFKTLVTILRQGWPIPLAAVTMNRRSFVAIENLVDLLVTCCDHPAAVNQVFLVSDGEDLSTANFLRRLAETMGRPVHLFPVPLQVLALGAKFLGRPELFQSLCGSLQVDMSKTSELLGWSPLMGVGEGLKRALGEHWC